MTEALTNQPTHRLFAVTKSGNTRKFWQPIGALWPHQDGKGFNLQLDYLPRLTDAQLVVRTIEERPEATTASQGGAQ